MNLATLTNEYGDAVGKLALFPGVWMESPSFSRMDPQITIGGPFSEGWRFKFSIFLSRTNPPQAITPDPKGLGVIVNKASYKISESGSNGNLIFPTDELNTQSDLLLLIQINGALQGLSLNDAHDNVIFSQQQLFKLYPHAFISSENPAFTGLMVVPQGTQMVILAEGERKYLQVFDAKQLIDQGVELCFKSRAKENKGRLIEAAMARACLDSSDNIVQMTTPFVASARRA